MHGIFHFQILSLDEFIMETKNKEDSDNEANSSETYEPNAYFEPVVSLPLVKPVTLEEDESTLLKIRAKLYRYDTAENPPMWKERGTGEVKILHHKVKHTVRVVMRRDKTLKICANHFITSSMELCKPNNTRKNWWIYTVLSDFADEVAKSEIFAIKFSNEENANLWKEAFEKAQIIAENGGDENSDEECKENKETGQSSAKNSKPKMPESEISKTMNELNISK